MSTLRQIPDADAKIAGFALFALMFFCVLSGSSNRIAGTGVSREGSNWIHMKFIPVPMHQQVLAKILPGFFVNALTALVFMGAGGLLLVIRVGINAVIVASGLVLMLAAGWLMCCVGAWSESRMPVVDWGNDGDVNVKSLKGGSELRSILVGLVYSALPLLVSPLVNLDPVVFMPILALVGTGVSVALGRVLIAAAVRNIVAFE